MVLEYHALIFTESYRTAILRTSLPRRAALAVQRLQSFEIIDRVEQLSHQPSRCIKVKCTVSHFEKATLNNKARAASNKNNSHDDDDDDDDKPTV